MTEQKYLNINELLQSQKPQILEIAAKHGAYNIRVFGSVARNEANTDSDIDLQRFAYPMGTARSCKQAEAEKLFVPDRYANRCISRLRLS